MLRELAAADYSMEEEEHYRGLATICRGIMPAPTVGTHWKF